MFVIEGTRGNADSLRALERAAGANSKVRFVLVKGADHFDVLAPANQLIAGKILKDTGPTCGLTLAADEIAKSFRE